MTPELRQKIEWVLQDIRVLMRDVRRFQGLDLIDKFFIEEVYGPALKQLLAEANRQALILLTIHLPKRTLHFLEKLDAFEERSRHSALVVGTIR